MFVDAKQETKMEYRICKNTSVIYRQRTGPENLVFERFIKAAAAASYPKLVTQ